MEIILNKENQKTYDNLIELFKRENRVAIIQPTGTGKTMTALKFIGELKNKKVLYITSFNSTVNNLKDKMKEYDISSSDIQITTYRNLAMNFDTNQEFDYVVIDEYHHAGAPVTNEKLNFIINRNPNVKLLGLTATPVRYLDNKRDMTEELFDGVVAGEMSLEYAIAHKLLPEFSYINALFQEDFNEIIESYYGEVNEVDPSNQKEYLKLLSYLKENIKELAGINRIFKKYLKSNGKYVVFCENKNQMEDIIKSLREGKLDWFNGTTNSAYIYSLYYGNDANINDMNLEGFQKENRSGIKLLFNINMASEGLHFDSLDGVIMLRSTTSPNLFIQQLGRALSINTKEEPVIFDLVSNISNDNIFNFLNGVSREVVRGIQNGDDEDELTDIRKLAIHDELKKVREIIGKLNRLKVTTWDKNFNSLWLLNDVLLDYKNELGEPALLEDVNFKGNSYQLNLMFNGLDSDIQKWILMQQKLYQNMELRYDRVKKLQAIGLLPPKEKFNETDYEIYKNFINQVKPFEKRIGMKLHEYPIEEQMFLIKNHIDKYYYSRDNQGYTLEDYIQEATLALVNASKTYSKEKKYYPYYVDTCIFKQRKEFLKTDDFKTVDLEEANNIEVSTIDELEEAKDTLKLYENLNDTLSTISKREEYVIRAHYGLDDGVPKTFEKIGKELNITGSRAGGIHQKALRRLKQKHRNKYIFKDTNTNLNSFEFANNQKPLWVMFSFKSPLIKKEIIENIPSKDYASFGFVEDKFKKIIEVLTSINNDECKKIDSIDEILVIINNLEKYITTPYYKEIVQSLKNYISDYKAKNYKNNISISKR